MLRPVILAILLVCSIGVAVGAVQPAAAGGPLETPTPDDADDSGHATTERGPANGSDAGTHDASERDRGSVDRDGGRRNEDWRVDGRRNDSRANVGQANDGRANDEAGRSVDRAGGHGVPAGEPGDGGPARVRVGDGPADHDRSAGRSRTAGRATSTERDGVNRSATVVRPSNVSVGEAGDGETPRRDRTAGAPATGDRSGVVGALGPEAPDRAVDGSAVVASGGSTLDLSRTPPEARPAARAPGVGPALERPPVEGPSVQGFLQGVLEDGPRDATPAVTDVLAGVPDHGRSDDPEEGADGAQRRSADASRDAPVDGPAQRGTGTGEVSPDSSTPPSEERAEQVAGNGTTDRGEPVEESGGEVPPGGPAGAGAALVLTVGYLGGSRVAVTQAGLLAATGPEGTLASLRAIAGEYLPGMPDFVPPAVVGYSRHDGSDPLENETRAAIYEQVSESPGIYHARLAEETDVAVETVRYHCRILAEEGLVEPRKHRGKRRLYPVSMDDEDPELGAAMADSAAADVLSAIERLEPATISSVAEHVGCAPSTVTYHLDRLEEDGLVTRERDGGAVEVRLRRDARSALQTSVADD